MKKLRVVVIGYGHLGRIHTRLAAEVEQIELVGVVEPSDGARERAAQACDVPVFASHRPILDRFDAAIVAAPTSRHHAIGMELLWHGKHVLLEKPITTNSIEARQLVALAAARDLTLAVGHVERFNPAFLAAVPHASNPQYIQATRAGGVTFRSMDAGVVYDLMIHDLDLVLSMVDSPVERVEAFGAALLGGEEDLAQARLYFHNGCIADLSASRMSHEPARRLTAYCEAGYVDVDFATRSARAVTPGQLIGTGQFNAAALPADQREQAKERFFQDVMPLAELEVADSNALADEITDFATCVLEGKTPHVTGAAGAAAVDVAEQILTSIANHRWATTDTPQIGPQFISEPAILHTPHWSAEPASERRRAG